MGAFAPGLSIFGSKYNAFGLVSDHAGIPRSFPLSLYQGSENAPGWNTGHVKSAARLIWLQNIAHDGTKYIIDGAVTTTVIRTNKRGFDHGVNNDAYSTAFRSTSKTVGSFLLTTPFYFAGAGGTGIGGWAVVSTWYTPSVQNLTDIFTILSNDIGANLPAPGVRHDLILYLRFRKQGTAPDNGSGVGLYSIHAIIDDDSSSSSSSHSSPSSLSSLSSRSSPSSASSMSLSSQSSRSSLSSHSLSSGSSLSSRSSLSSVSSLSSSSSFQPFLIVPLDACVARDVYATGCVRRTIDTTIFIERTNNTASEVDKPIDLTSCVSRSVDFVWDMPATG